MKRVKTEAKFYKNNRNYEFCKTFRLPPISSFSVAGPLLGSIHSPILFMARNPTKPVGLAAVGNWRKDLSKAVGLWGGLACFILIIAFGEFDPDNPAVKRMAAVAALMAIWWVFEAIPLAATSLVPMVAFPLLGIASGSETAPVYMNHIIFLFLGGFLIALAMERWHLHRRIALAIISVIGVKPSRLVLGFMLATAFLSMWISNTATTIMMLAIALSVIREAEDSFGAERTAPLSVALLLGVAYGASIGGIATLVGTPPNLALVRFFELNFPGAEAAGYRIGFGQWMLLGVPLSAALFVAAWLILTRVAFPCPRDLELSRESIDRERAALGPMSREEAFVASIFALTALLWIFRVDLQLGGFTLPGWAGWLPYGSYLDDGTVAVTMALLLFFIPARATPPGAADEGAGSDAAAGEAPEAPTGATPAAAPAVDEARRGRLLDKEIFAKVPWHIILLFGGGFALAEGFQTSGLSHWLKDGFTGLEDAPLWVLVAGVTGGITFLTEFTSNTATTQTILPVLASIATGAELHPLTLMVPAAIAASCAFMMPVATPPNAIVFASGRVRVSQMVKAGILLNLTGILIVTAVFLLLGPLVFNMDPLTLPAWAAPEAAPGP